MLTVKETEIRKNSDINEKAAVRFYNKIKLKH